MSKMVELKLYSPIQIDIIDRDRSDHAVPLQAVSDKWASEYLGRIMNSFREIQPQEDARNAFIAPEQDWSEICEKIVSLTRAVEAVNGTLQTVNKILANEKYVGDALAQKTYTTSVFPYERRVNKGDVDQYYTENSHPAIISRDTFERAQALMKRRAQRVAYVPKEYPLSRKIICGDCGTLFIRRKSPSGYVSWVCRKHDDRAADCPVGRIAETEIYTAFLRMYCCPSSVQDELSSGFYQADALTDFLDEIAQRCRFRYQFFGHYHTNKVIREKFVLLYEQIIKLKL